MKVSSFFTAPHTRSPVPLKKAIQFFNKIGSAMLARIRKFKWQKCLPWCALFLGICIFCAASFLAISMAVKQKMEPRITTGEALTSAGEHFDVILVLGCAVRADGSPSHMLEDRITTGVSLYRAGIADTVLMSGDRHEGYDEVGTMKSEAQKLGVPVERIEIDPTGFSTYDSIANLLEQYKGKRVLIVTQKYHLYRALYIAEKLGINAYGISANLRTYTKQFKFDVREILARVKDVFWVQYNLK
jgi:vancomycin permeability regulator SanA